MSAVMSDLVFRSMDDKHARNTQGKKGGVFRRREKAAATIQRSWRQVHYKLYLSREGFADRLKLEEKVSISGAFVAVEGITYSVMISAKQFRAL